jgi:regulator of extracellular matrix RemA (YlzA/DUF370 family)
MATESTELIHIGLGNVLAVNRLIGILAPNAAPTKRLIQEARHHGRTVDVTGGRRTKAVLVMDDGHLVLAAITAETITSRVRARRDGAASAESAADD